MFFHWMYYRNWNHAEAFLNYHISREKFDYNWRTYQKGARIPKTLGIYPYAFHVLKQWISEKRLLLRREVIMYVILHRHIVMISNVTCNVHYYYYWKYLEKMACKGKMCCMEISPRLVTRGPIGNTSWLIQVMGYFLGPLHTVQSLI